MKKTEEDKEEDLKNLSEHLLEAVRNVVGLVREYEKYDYAETVAVVVVGMIAESCSRTKVDGTGILEVAKYQMLKVL